MIRFTWKAAAAAGLLALAAAAPFSVRAENEGWWERMGQMMTSQWSQWGGQWGGGPMMGQWGDGPMMGFGMGRGMSGPMMGFGYDMMLDRVDGRLAYLKTELKITDAQAPAWDDLATAVRNSAETHNDMMRSMMEDYVSGEFLKKSLPDRLTFQETHLEARLEEVRTVHASVDKLYAVLSDQQKQVADEIVLPTMGMGMGRPRGFGPRLN
jgi:hypothetical protein